MNTFRAKVSYHRSSVVRLLTTMALVAVNVCVIFCVIVVSVGGLKYGSQSSTLHVTPLSDEELLGPGMRRIVKENYHGNAALRRSIRDVHQVQQQNATSATNISSMVSKRSLS